MQQTKNGFPIKAHQITITLPRLSDSSLVDAGIVMGFSSKIYSDIGTLDAPVVILDVSGVDPQLIGQLDTLLTQIYESQKVADLLGSDQAAQQ